MLAEDDVREGSVLPSQRVGSCCCKYKVSEFAGWHFKWRRLETSFIHDADGNLVGDDLKHLVAFSLDGQGTVERELNAVDFKALQCGATLECALSCVGSC